MDAGVVAGAAGGKDVRDAIDSAGGDEHFWFDEGELTHGVKVEFGSEMGEGFEFFDVEIGAKIIAEGISKTDEVGEGELLFEDFVFDADEDFLLGSAAAKVATGGAMTSTGESNCFDAANGVGLTGFKDDTGIIIVFDVFIEGDSDAA